jgi:hypothetical protein
MMPLASFYASVPTESPAPTGAPSFFISFVHSDPAPTDAAWPWAHDFAAVTDPALRFPATPLLLPHHGSFASGVRVEPLVDIDIMVVVDEGAHGPTRTVAEEATVTIGPGDDWATMISRLLEHDLHELRWLRSRTSVRVVFEEAVPRDLVPPLWFKVGQQHEQPLGDVEGSEPTQTRRDAIVAGRDLHAGLRAVDDLRRWLSLSVAEVARIAGLSESTVYWWAEHPTSTPRPAKIDRLLGLQALAWGLVEDLGEPMTRRWFRAGRPSPLDLLRRDPEALPVVEEQGYRLLQRLANKRLADAGPGRLVTDDDDQRDVARLADQERELTERLAARELDPRRLEPEDLE